MLRDPSQVTEEIGRFTSSFEEPPRPKGGIEDAEPIIRPHGDILLDEGWFEIRFEHFPLNPVVASMEVDYPV